MLSEQQKHEREKKVGSSDAPIACGVSPYASPRTLFHQLRGELPRYSQEQSWEQRIGSLVEPIIAKVVAEDQGLKIRRAPLAIHKQYPWMVAHLDFEIIDHPGGPGVFEIKRRQKHVDVLPDDIQIQVAHQLAVTNRQWAKVAVMPFWGYPQVFHVERDLELEAYLIEILTKFMARVEANDPPPFEWNAETAEILKALYPVDNGKVVQLVGLESDMRFMRLLKMRDNVRVFAEAVEAEEAWFKAQLADASVAEIPNMGSISWKKSKDGTKFDLERFQKEQPDLFKQYQTPKPGNRRFLIKEAKE